MAASDPSPGTFPRRTLLQIAAGLTGGAALWHLLPHDPTAVLNPILGLEDPLALHPELATPRVPGELRVLCLGDSLTFGYPYGLPASFAAIAEAGLRAVFPDRRVLVKAIAKPAVDSVQVAAMLEASLAARPDLVLAVVGGNEVGARLFFGKSLTPAGLLEAIADHGTRSRMFFLGLAASAAGASGPADPDLLGGLVARVLDARPGVPVVAGLPVSQGDRAVLTQRARGSLRRMAAAARGAGVPLLFAPSPFDLAGAWPRGMTTLARDADRAVFAWQLGQPPMRSVADALVRHHPGRADVHALLGRVLLAAYEPEAARAAFVLARDLDEAPLHMIGEVEAAIRSEGDALGVPVVDVEADTYLPGTKIPDPALFLDPQHWNLDGARRCATWLVGQLLTQGVLASLPDGWRTTFDAAVTAHLDRAVDAERRKGAIAEMARATAAYHMLFGSVRDAALPLADGVEWLASVLPGPDSTVWVDWALRLTIATAGAGNRIDEVFGGTPEAKNKRANALTRTMWDAARAGRLRAYVAELVGGAAFP